MSKQCKGTEKAEKIVKKKWKIKQINYLDPRHPHAAAALLSHCACKPTINRPTNRTKSVKGTSNRCDGTRFGDHWCVLVKQKNATTSVSKIFFRECKSREKIVKNYIPFFNVYCLFFYLIIIIKIVCYCVSHTPYSQATKRGESSSESIRSNGNSPFLLLQESWNHCRSLCFSLCHLLDLFVWTFYLPMKPFMLFDFFFHFLFFYFVTFPPFSYHLCNFLYFFL